MTFPMEPVDLNVRLVACTQCQNTGLMALEGELGQFETVYCGRCEGTGLEIENYDDSMAPLGVVVAIGAAGRVGNSADLNALYDAGYQTALALGRPDYPE